MMNAHARNVIPESDTEQESWISALLDGELDDDEAMRSIDLLGKDGTAARCWSEYSLIGDAMRGCTVAGIDLDSRVKAALAAEPTVLAPVAKSHYQPAYWAAAAMAVVAITWTVLSMAPVGEGKGMLAANTPASAQAAAEARDVAQNDVAPYLAAHQDYAFAVAGEPDMNITPVSLSGDGR